jgi:hypothetical protein
MAKRTYIATIEIDHEVHEHCGCTFHQPWVYEHSIETAVQAISGHKVTVKVPELAQPWVTFIQRLLTRMGARYHD